MTLAGALAAALAGFLWYNRPPARVYLGDGGAYFLGPPWRHCSRGHGAEASAPRSAWRASCWWRFPWPRSLSPSSGVRGPAKSVSHGDRRHPYDLLVAAGRRDRRRRALHRGRSPAGAAALWRLWLRTGRGRTSHGRDRGDRRPGGPGGSMRGAAPGAEVTA